jgi:hypothetical protein
MLPTQCATGAGHVVLTTFVNQILRYLDLSGIYNNSTTLDSAPEILNTYLLQPFLDFRACEITAQQLFNQIYVVTQYYPDATTQIQTMFDTLIRPAITNGVLPTLTGPFMMPMSQCTILSKIGDPLPELPAEIQVEILHNTDLRSLLRAAQAGVPYSTSNVVWRRRYFNLSNDQGFLNAIIDPCSKESSAINVWNQRDTLIAPENKPDFFYTRFKKLWVSFVHRWAGLHSEIVAYRSEGVKGDAITSPFIYFDLETNTGVGVGNIPSIKLMEIQNAYYTYSSKSGTLYSVELGDAYADNDGDIVPPEFNINDVTITYNNDQVAVSSQILNFESLWNAPNEFYIIIGRKALYFRLRRQRGVKNAFGLFQSQYQYMGLCNIWVHSDAKNDSLSCSVCAAPARYLCSHCMDTPYCSEKCQRIDFNTH